MLAIPQIVAKYIQGTSVAKICSHIDRYQQITNLLIKESIKIYLRLNSSLLKIGLIVDELLVPFQNFSSLYIALNFVLTNNPKSFSLFVSQGSAQTHAVNRISRCRIGFSLFSFFKPIVELQRFHPLTKSHSLDFTKSK